jgi:DNA-binding CsgD family transcriptional regulator
MAQFPRLSNREWEVVTLLLQGKSNKLIASSLGISDRTVEFHLTNVYAKFEVSTRVELILKLGNPAGGLEIEKPGYSTVEDVGGTAENRDRANSGLDWTRSLRDTVSINGTELDMKSILSKHVLIAVGTALLTGLTWVAVLTNSGNLSASDFKAFTIPLTIILILIGTTVGVVGKRTSASLIKTFFSVLLGAGLSPFTVIPLMILIVLPAGKLAERFGIIDPATMPGKVASDLTMTAMLILWLVVGAAIGITALLLSIKISVRRPKADNSQGLA